MKKTSLLNQSIKFCSLLLTFFFSYVAANAQLSYSNLINKYTTDAIYQTSTSQNNLILTPNKSVPIRLGLLADNADSFGGYWGNWASIGNANVYSKYDNTMWVTPAANNMFGLLTQTQTDRAFFGQRVSGSDAADAIIAWGDNDGTTTGSRADKLIFSFSGINNCALSGYGYQNNYQGFDMAAFTPQGNFGIGTISPTAQLHTTGSVRFQGLTTAATTPNLVGIDANGILYKTTASGLSNSCATTNFIPKTLNTTGALTCSQIFDNGVSVGIGSTGSFAYTWPGGLIGSTAPPTTGNVRLDINGVSRALAYYATSDRRFKKDIRPVENALEIVRQLNPVRYSWASEKMQQYEFSSIPQIGFIAQEVADILPETVIKDENGYYSMNYTEIIPILTKAIKEQQKQIEELSSTLTLLKNKTTEGSKNKSRIYQNYPNPHSGHTSVKYEVYDEYNTGGIYLLDMNGRILQSKPIYGTGAGEITFDMSEMAPGIYLYSLILDGKEIETKKMTLLNENVLR